MRASGLSKWVRARRDDWFWLASHDNNHLKRTLRQAPWLVYTGGPWGIKYVIRFWDGQMSTASTSLCDGEAHASRRTRWMRSGGLTSSWRSRALSFKAQKICQKWTATNPNCWVLQTTHVPRGTSPLSSLHTVDQRGHLVQLSAASQFISELSSSRQDNTVLKGFNFAARHQNRLLV